MCTIFRFVQTILPPSDEGGGEFVSKETNLTEGGKNYKLDVLIGYYLINLYYINNPTNPNLYNNKNKKFKNIATLSGYGKYY